MKSISIRPERSSEYGAIYKLVSEVFLQTYGSGEQEAELVEQLRQRTEFGATISLVADIDGVVVGHILFSAVRLSDRQEIAVCALAPLGVYRQYQKQGDWFEISPKWAARMRESGLQSRIRSREPRILFSVRFQTNQQHSSSNDLQV